MSGLTPTSKCRSLKWSLLLALAIGTLCRDVSTGQDVGAWDPLEMSRLRGQVASRFAQSTRTGPRAVDYAQPAQTFDTPHTRNRSAAASYNGWVDDEHWRREHGFLSDAPLDTEPNANTWVTPNNSALGLDSPPDQANQWDNQDGSMQSLGSWLDDVKVGYDDGFIISVANPNDLSSNDDYRLSITGWGQLRHTIFESQNTNRDLSQFQLKRARVALSGNVFTEHFGYFIQLDGRSTSGDEFRLLDYFLTYDFGAEVMGYDPGSIVFKTGKYKMPFHMARFMSGRDFEFSDRSVASTFFDVNRSLAWGLAGQSERGGVPVFWETAIFNGLVTGGAETGSSGSLDNNFAYSGRVFCYPIGEWGDGFLADFDNHQLLATRIGAGFAATTIDRTGDTEFKRLRVVDSGGRLFDLLPNGVNAYDVQLASLDASMKYQGFSTSIEYYFRSINNFRGQPVVDLFDHGFWFQMGYFVCNEKLQVVTRWSRTQGDSGTLGVSRQSSDEIGAAIVWYFREQHAKFVVDVTYLDGAPVDSSALDITPGADGTLVRSQIQFAF